MPKDEPVITPIIHLNGDRKDTLIRQLQDAYTAVNEARDALRACSPNARNYYLDPGRLGQAQAQHLERMAHLQAVAASLDAEARQLDKEYPA